MSDRPGDDPAPPDADPGPLAEPRAEPNWKLRITLALLLVALLVTAYLVGTTLVPRWWAQRVGDRVEGSITAGTFYGLFIGFVFVLAPLVVLRQACRRFPGWLRALLVAAALVVALPNLMTLSIVLGNGDGAHAGERILDTEGPGFRAGSAWGAATAAVVALVMVVRGWQWRRDRRRLHELRRERQTSREE